MPPPIEAELSLSVLLAICIVPPLKQAPPYAEAVLPLNVLLVIVTTVAGPLLWTPAPLIAVLPLKVLFKMVRVPKFSMPPPEPAIPPAELPLTVLLTIVSVPLLKMPPPSTTGLLTEPAVLLLRVLLVMVNVAPLSFSMPPPILSSWPFLIVRPEMVTVSPEPIWKTRLEALPSTASTSAPAALIVTLLSTSNSPLVRVMTPEMPVASIVSPSFAFTSA